MSLLERSCALLRKRNPDAVVNDKALITLITRGCFIFIDSLEVQSLFFILIVLKIITALNETCSVLSLTVVNEGIFPKAKYLSIHLLKVQEV